MISPIARWVIRGFSRNRSDVRWFLVTLRRYQKAELAGETYRGQRVRRLRLAVGQAFLLLGIERPVWTLLGPIMATAAYLYFLFHLGR